MQSKPEARRAVFVDRDGTLIPDQGYLRDARQVRLLPGAGEVLRELQARGFGLALISNQSGVGRGWITAQEARQVHEALRRALARCGVRFDAVRYCLHRPEDGCRCRKPSPGMLLDAAGELRVSLEHSVMVGDKVTDVEAGRRAGCRTVLLSRRRRAATGPLAADSHARGWKEVLASIEEIVPG